MNDLSPTTRAFTTTVLWLIRQSGHGSQSVLAKQARISTSYLSDLLHGRKPYWPDPVKERIASFYGYSVAELLEIGQSYLSTGVFWPYGRRVSSTMARSLERLAQIYQLAAVDSGLGMGHVLFTPVTLPVMFKCLATEYRTGAIDDPSAYREAVSACQIILGKNAPKSE